MFNTEERGAVRREDTLNYIKAQAFSDSLRKYLRDGGRFQKSLADALGLHPKVLSRKLRGNGDSHLTEDEVRRIITALAQWEVITTREEALRLLELAQLKPGCFSDQEWQSPPLSRLVRSDLPNNLSAPLTRLVGREEEVEQLRQLLAHEEIRLITLVGAGGSGKTRLALQVANELTGSFAQGVWFVALAPVHDAAYVLQSIMQALNIQPTPGLPALQCLTTYLRHKQLLLILDNFEQVGEAADLVGELLAAAAGLKVLVTSRVVLRLYGEREFNVPPLDVPDPGVVPTWTKLARYGAVRLFVERAIAVQPDFNLTSGNAAIIAQICARVDGLPLALELAAARIKVLSPEQLLARLSEARLSVLTGGARNLPERQQTLRKTIQWSYDLLSPGGQAWFARLAVFFGGWSLEAAESMLQALATARGQDEEEAHDAGSALQVLEHLLDSSLLVKLPVTAEQARFTMLETLREYALECLKERGEFVRLRDWHSCYYLGVVEEAASGLQGTRQLIWHARLVAEQDNFRAALEWSLLRAGAGASLERSEAGAHLPAVEVALRMAAALRSYWEWQGYLVEGRDWLEAVLALPLAEDAARTTRAARASALSEAVRLVCLQNEQSRSVELGEESIKLWQELDDPRGLAAALFHRGWPAIAQGDFELAKSVFERGLQLLSPHGNVWLRAQLLFYLGDVAGFSGNYEQMHMLFAQSKILFEEIGDETAITDVLKDQGGMAILEGNYTQAIADLLKSIRLSYKLGYRQFVGTGLGLLGYAVGLRGEPDAVAASLQAARIWGAAHGLLGAIGSNPWLSNNPIVQEMIVQILTRVDDASWKAAWREGRSLTGEQEISAYLATQVELSTL